MFNISLCNSSSVLLGHGAAGKRALQKKAEKFELKKFRVLKVDKELVLGLEPLLQDVYANRHPKPADYEVRRDLVRVFNEIAKEIYGHSKDIPVVVEYGSFVMDIFSTSSDLDLSVNFSTTTVPFPREKKIQTLRKFAKKLYAIQSKGHVSGVLPITTAKVPILKCVDCGTGVECDISVENRDGILKSQIIHIISSIDDRFPKLSFLMKTWAKAYNINSSKDKTLNSLSIILLVAFHLQTRDPPILPPFSSIFKDGTDPETVAKSMSNFVNYGNQNRESLAELFVTLLIKLSSVEKLWPKGLCVSTCSGSWTSKTFDSKVASISVEDFTDPSQNVARAVGQAEVKQIYKCINISIQHIFSFMDRKIGAEVKDLLFGKYVIHPTPSFTRGYASNLHPTMVLPCYIPYQPNQIRRVETEKRKKQATDEFEWAKKMRIAEGWRGMPSGSLGPVNFDGIRTQNDDVVPYDPMRRQMGGWDGNWQPGAGGWGRTTPQQLGAGGWGETQHHIRREGWR
ncbi:hypothetical protein CASFOL_032796 [Castilleja foliolosa]|uniref:Poly(A) RNA polymerase mitochondrial-like central palm domain-containing protein n=1 Tax=Castilleja foliolosa TaxID=1961234 RepID=A0ABD3C569_9LAMI